MLSLTAVASTVLLVGVHYTDACRLEQVTYNYRLIEDWEETLGLDSRKSVVRQPVDSLAAALLEAGDVFKVDISYRLPNGIDISTNSFHPLTFLVDASSGELYGLTREARVVPLTNSEINWEHPVLTSVKAGPVYDFCSDPRVLVIVQQLDQLRTDNVDLYRLIDEIDFGYESFVQVALSGLPYRLKIRAESFREHMHEFVLFVSRFAPDLTDVTSVDLRFDDMIICTRGNI